ncbi:MAG: cyclic nucleotide-binding domain-containing protein [Myxococcota bacterium]
MENIGQLRTHGDTKLFAGEFGAALHAYAALCRIQPGNLDARLRAADALLALGEVQRAATVYTALARHAANAGYPLHALIALKVLSALEPSLETLLTGLAELYAEGSARLSGRAVRISPGDDDQPLPSGFHLDKRPDDATLVEVGTQVATDLSAIAAYPEHLPPIPLFSELPGTAFAAVLSALKLVRKKPAEEVLREGEVGRSFYVLARGTVRVTRLGEQGPIHLATLHEGSIFGEMALVSALPRSATVTADTDCDLLEFDRTALASASDEVGTIARALDKFTRERLLHNLLATAPLFKPLDRKQRFDLVRRFSAHDLVPGTVVIREGAEGQGLYVVLNGELDVSKVDGEEKVLLATLKPGDVFGEISLIHDEPTTATVTAASNATVMFLAKNVFHRLVEAVDEIRTYIENLGDERLMDTQILLSSETASESETLSDDDLIMI